MLERLQKVLAAAGIGSRRYCEELIRAGRVKVDGEQATLGLKVDPENSLILVDGKRVFPAGKKICLLVNKPVGYVSTVKDPQGRPKVTDLAPLPGVRLFPVGRLDFRTSGLILLTNDGELANLLTHPKYGIWKTYHALVRGVPDRQAINRLRRGVTLAEGKTAPARVKLLKVLPGSRSLLEISLREGKKRQVRRMCQQVGYPVLELQRVRFAFLTLEGLPSGAYRRLTEAEMGLLKKQARMGTQFRSGTGQRE